VSAIRSWDDVHLVIQTTNTRSDERTEFLIKDRLSFMRFLGLKLSDRVPDARTIWLFREKLTKAGAIGPLFERFDVTLRQSGYIAMSGQIVDASLIAARAKVFFPDKLRGYRRRTACRSRAKILVQYPGTEFPKTSSPQLSPKRLLRFFHKIHPSF
jgi:hypothetical protein